MQFKGGPDTNPNGQWYPISMASPMVQGIVELDPPCHRLPAPQSEGRFLRSPRHTHAARLRHEWCAGNRMVAQGSFRLAPSLSTCHSTRRAVSPFRCSDA